MKKKLLIFFLFSFCLFTQSFGQIPNLKSLLFTKQFPQLEKALSFSKVSWEDNIIYQSFLLNAYNNPKASDKLLTKIFKQKIKTDDDSLQFYLHKISYDNKVKLYNYRSAYIASEILLTKYSKFFDSSELEDQKEESKIWKYLIDEPAQKIITKETAHIPIQYDLAGLWNIPVSNGISTYQFVFDTGAGISSITETYAQKLKLNLFKDSRVSIRGGLNGISTSARIGVAKQLKIGKLIIQNAVFLIFPDSALSFAGGFYKIKGIIGLPIIKELGEIIIGKNEMTVPKKINISSPNHNMILDLLKPVLYIEYIGESIPCTFDCGAQNTIFSKKFYNKFKTDLMSTGKMDTISIGGAGGNRQIPSVEVAKLNFNVNNSLVQLSNVQVSLEDLHAEKQYYYGNIGQDVIKQFNTIIINFITSSIKFKMGKPD